MTYKESFKYIISTFLDLEQKTKYHKVATTPFPPNFDSLLYNYARVGWYLFVCFLFCLRLNDQEAWSHNYL